MGEEIKNLGNGQQQHSLQRSQYCDRSRIKTWIPRKLEFKGCGIPIFSRITQWITDSQVKTVLDDLEKFMPQDIQKWINWTMAKENFVEYVVEA